MHAGWGGQPLFQRPASPRLEKCGNKRISQEHAWVACLAREGIGHTMARRGLRGVARRSPFEWVGGGSVPPQPPLRWAAGMGAGASRVSKQAAGLLQQRLQEGDCLRQLRALAISQAGQPSQGVGPEGGKACGAVRRGRVERRQ